MNPPAADDPVTEMFHAHGRALLLYARQWVGPAGAEDVVQRVFVRLLAAGGARPADPRTWLFRCVRNEAASAWRADRRRSQRERSAAGAAPTWFVPRPEDRIDAAAAEAALQALPPVQREVVTLRVWSGLTLAETAEVTGLAVSSAHHHFRAGLAALRQRLESPCKTPNPSTRPSGS